MIIAEMQPHAGTINDLAKRGLIEPASFELDGQRYDANSVWAATEWLKKRGVADVGRHRWVQP